MFESKSDMMEEFKDIVILIIGVYVTFLVASEVAVFSHQYILGVLPAGEWSLIIGWILAIFVGHVFVVGMIVGFAVLGSYLGSVRL